MRQSSSRTICDIAFPPGSTGLTPPTALSPPDWRIKSLTENLGAEAHPAVVPYDVLLFVRPNPDRPEEAQRSAQPATLRGVLWHPSGAERSSL
jgi:hypothetical protein